MVGVLIHPLRMVKQLKERGDSLMDTIFNFSCAKKVATTLRGDPRSPSPSGLPGKENTKNNNVFYAENQGVAHNEVIGLYGNIGEKPVTNNEPTQNRSKAKNILLPNRSRE